MASASTHRSRDVAVTSKANPRVFRGDKERLVRLLVERCDHQQRVLETHKLLADELGTAREVVSRRLKDMEKRGLLRLSRGQIQIQDLEGLRKIYRPE